MKKFTFLIVSAFFFIFTIANAQQWVECNNGLPGRNIQSLKFSGSDIYVRVATDEGIYLSTNNGTSWSAFKIWSDSLNVICFSVNGSDLYIGTSGGLYVSSDKGANWSLFSSGLNSIGGYSLTFNGTNIYADTYMSGIYISTDNGSTWNATNTGIPDKRIMSFAICGNTLFWGTYGYGVYKSTDNGASWTASGLSGMIVFDLVANGTDILAGTQEGNGVSLSTDNGTTWTAINSGLTEKWIVPLAVSGSNILAGTWGGGVFLSKNYGKSWTAINSGLTDLNVLQVAITSTNIFAGTQTGGVFKMDLSILGVDEPNINSNYEINPNPVQDLLTLSYKLNVESRNISISIHNQLGEPVIEKVIPNVTIDNTLQIDTKSLASGIYYCIIKAGNTTESKKFVIIR